MSISRAIPLPAHSSSFIPKQLAPRGLFCSFIFYLSVRKVQLYLFMFIAVVKSVYLLWRCWPPWRATISIFISSMAGGKRKLLSETIFVTVFILFYLLKISTHLYRYQMLIKCISNAYQQYNGLSVIQSVSPQDGLSAVGGLSSEVTPGSGLCVALFSKKIHFFLLFLAYLKKK